MEWWGTLLITVAGSLITGIFTLWASKLGLDHQNRQKREDELKKEYTDRPRLEIIRYECADNGDSGSSSDCDCLLAKIEDFEQKDGRPLFFYDKKVFDDKNLCFVEYELKNTGKTEIESVCVVSTYQEAFALFDLDTANALIKNNGLCYESWSNKRFIKPGDVISLRIYYLKGQSNSYFSSLCAMVGLYLEDINGNYWHQALFFPTETLENSRKVSYESFKEERNVKHAIDCFKDPTLW